MRYVIIGSSAAGMAAARAIQGRDKQGSILILSDEPHRAYYRPLLPTFIQNWITRDGLFWERTLLPQPDARFQVGRVERIQPAKKTVVLTSGEPVPYDRLLVATGASAAQPPIRGLDGPGVYSLRTLADADSIIAAVEQGGTVAIIGGGRVGMKTAMALHRRSMQVVVIEQGERVVPLQLDVEAAQIVGRAVEELGIRLVLGQTVVEVVRENGRVSGIVTADGRTFPANLIVVATGITSRTELAKDAGLNVRQGIQTNGRLQTSNPDVYAAGDVAESIDIITRKSVVPGTWTEATTMGRVAGTNMSGGHAEYAGSLGVQNSFQVAGIPSVSVGHIDPALEDGCEVHSRRKGDMYRKLVVKDGCLVGALLVGDIDAAGVCTGLIKRQIEVGRHLEDLLNQRPSCAPWIAKGARRRAQGRSAL
jgi:nitrite reductase (NADH) large subunit